MGLLIVISNRAGSTVRRTPSRTVYSIMLAGHNGRRSNGSAKTVSDKKSPRVANTKLLVYTKNMPLLAAGSPVIVNPVKGLMGLRPALEGLSARWSARRKGGEASRRQGTKRPPRKLSRKAPYRDCRPGYRGAGTRSPFGALTETRIRFRANPSARKPFREIARGLERCGVIASELERGDRWSTFRPIRV
jgi:hypothetical protein